MTPRITEVSMGDRSQLGITVQQAGMVIRTTVLQLQRGRRMEGLCEIDNQRTCIRGVYLLLGKVLGLIVDMDGIEHWF